MSESTYSAKGYFFSVFTLLIIGVSVGLGWFLLRPLIREAMEKRACPSKDMPNGQVRHRYVGRRQVIECYDSRTFKSIDISYIDIVAVCPTFVLFFGGMFVLLALLVITRRLEPQRLTAK